MCLYGLFNYLNNLLIQEGVVSLEADDQPSRVGKQVIYQFRSACLVKESAHLIYIHPGGDPQLQEQSVMLGLAASPPSSAEVQHCQVQIDDLEPLERSGWKKHCLDFMDNQSGLA